MDPAFNPLELSYLLECGICLNRFQDPRVLPCLHSYCLECLRKHVESNTETDETFKCPQCREQCQIPAEGIDKFAKNFFVNALTDVLPASFLLEPTIETDVTPGPPMCKHHSAQGNAEEHGEAVIFCLRCDSYFCKVCSKHHGMFDVTKDHKVYLVDGQQSEREMRVSPSCGFHNQQLNWYCKGCTIPACSECIVEKHYGHDVERMSVVEAGLKKDTAEVSFLAAKRLQAMQKMSADIELNEIKMEEELDELSKEISDTADALCTLIRQQETSLQQKVQTVKETAKKQFKTAKKELETVRKNTTLLKSRAEGIQHTSSEQALCTVVQAPVNIEQYFHHQEIPVDTIKWKLFRTTFDSSAFQLGSVSIAFNEQIPDANIAIEEPLQITKLEYGGIFLVCSITRIFKSMICVAHFANGSIWVYREGVLQRKVEVSGIDNINGMVAANGEMGKLALVDNKHRKVYFVTLSKSLAVSHQAVVDLPIVPCCISMGSDKQLVVGSLTGRRFLSLNLDGQIISDIEVPMPHADVAIYGFCKTKSGFVVCDEKNKKVYFTENSGRILNTNTNCSSPWRPTQTCGGHVLIADYTGDKVKVFSQRGDFLGNVHDNSGNILEPHCTYLDDSDKLLYVACGQAGKMNLKTYKFGPCDLPIANKITELNTSVNLIRL